MAKKSEEGMHSWDKVYVIGGEPVSSRLSLDTLTQNKNTMRYNKGDNFDNLKLILSSYSIRPRTVVLYDPVADVLKTCLSVVESGKMTSEKLIIFINGDNIDGRLSFYSKATKQKRVFSFPYLEATDSSGLQKYINTWQKDTSVDISIDAQKWLLKNAPIIVEKIKTSGGKKEMEIYDLQNIEQELEKISTLAEYENRAISLEDFKEYCDFDQTGDIWEFIRTTIDGNYKVSFSLMKKMLDTQGGTNGVLYLLSAQLALLIQLKDLYNAGITDTNALMEKISLSDHLNKYCDENWEDIIKEAPAINFWRLRKAVESMAKWKIETLVKQQENVTCAIEDMRSSGSEDIVVPYLLLAMSGMARYNKPLYSYGE